MQKIKPAKLLEELEWRECNRPMDEYHILMGPYDKVSKVKNHIDSKIQSFNFGIIEIDSTLFALVARRS